MITLQYKLSDHIWIPAIRFIVVIEPHRQTINVEKTTISIEGKYKTVEFFSKISLTASSDTWAEFDPDWQGSDIRDQLYRTWFFYNPEFNVRLALLADFEHKSFRITPKYIQHLKKNYSK